MVATILDFFYPSTTGCRWISPFFVSNEYLPHSKYVWIQYKYLVSCLRTKVPNNGIFFLETLRNVTILLSTREQLVTQRRLNNNSRWINRAQHPSKPVKGLFGQSSTRGEGDGWSWMGLLLTKREFSPPFITLPLLHPFCSPKGWMLQCEKPCVCLVSLEYVTRCDKPPQAHNVVSKCK